ncbi:MAG: bis(5'-nucleosyl)-tetraphosphatase (symmetrical) YqeK [Sumerlaeia bacterium]
MTDAERALEAITTAFPPTLAQELRSELLQRTPNESRRVHVLGVEGMAVTLAEQWGLDAHACLIAALLHDLAKNDPKDEQRRKLGACTLFPPTDDDLDSPAIWHGLIAAQEGHDRYGIRHRSVLEAVAYHPTGADGLDEIGLTLFVADFIEPSRSWPGVENARRSFMAMDCRDAATAVAQHKLSFLRAKGRTIHPRTRAMLQWLGAETPDPVDSHTG